MKDAAENVEFYRIYNGQGASSTNCGAFREKKCPLSYFIFGFGGRGMHEYVGATEHNMISCPNCPTICKIFFNT